MLQRTLALLLIAAATLSAQRDPKAVEVATAMVKAMGGQEKWDAVQYVRFDFIVKNKGEVVAERSHLWDKQRGLHRIERKSKDGKQEVVFTTISNQTGKAFRDGKELTGTEAAEAGKGAYGAWINDVYWLSMPWKWSDGGVNLKYAGTAQRDGVTHDIVELTFGKVGLTPGDKYRAFVSQKTRMMTYWEYTLQSGNTGQWTWEYTTTGGVKLASTHKGQDREINMGTVKVLDSADDAWFSDPKRSLSTLK